MAQLKLSLRDQNRLIEEARTATLRFLIEERKQAMRAQGQRRGGVHEAAVEEIAKKQGMEPTALKQRLRRLNQRVRKKIKTKSQLQNSPVTFGIAAVHDSQ
jgi:hypothetical protein